MGFVKNSVRNGEIMIHKAEKLERAICSEEETEVNNVAQSYIREGEQIMKASAEKAIEWGEKVWDKSKDHLREIIL